VREKIWLGAAANVQNPSRPQMSRDQPICLSRSQFCHQRLQQSMPARGSLTST
jgi:hypothetical protein